MDGVVQDRTIALGPLIARLVAGEDLTAAEAEAAFTEVMEGRASPVQSAALLVGLRAKGEVPDEVAGGVRALQRAMIPVTAAEPEDVAGRPPSGSQSGPLVDTCGTGGGAFTTFNISTAAALLAAGAGAAIAKHGNRSFTSRCGSADVLEALGVTIELTPAGMGEVLRRAGIVFMYAPLLHPAMRHVGPVRRELGFPTIMNLLGPLTNPAGARRQLVGVSDPRMLALMGGALQQLGHEHALVVHGELGMDELSPVGPSEVVELRRGELRRFRVDPGDRPGWRDLDPHELAGGDPEENAQRVAEVLAGRGPRAARAAVALNAGAALFVAGRAASLEVGIDVAEQALAAGVGAAALDRLRRASGEVAEREHAGGVPGGG